MEDLTVKLEHLCGQLEMSALHAPPRPCRGTRPYSPGILVSSTLLEVGEWRRHLPLPFTLNDLHLGFSSFAPSNFIFANGKTSIA